MLEVSGQLHIMVGLSKVVELSGKGYLIYMATPPNRDGKRYERSNNIRLKLVLVGYNIC